MIELGIGRQRHKGDLTGEFRYINDEPALLIYRRAHATRVESYAICLSAAHQFLDDAYLVTESARIAQRVGLSVDRHSVARVADLVLDSLDDLVKMPPQMPKAPARDFDVTLKHGQIMIEGEEA